MIFLLKKLKVNPFHRLTTVIIIAKKKTYYKFERQKTMTKFVESFNFSRKFEAPLPFNLLSSFQSSLLSSFLYAFGE